MNEPLLALTLWVQPGMRTERAIWKACYTAYQLGCIVAFSINETSYKIHPLDNPRELVEALGAQKDEVQS